MPSWPGRFISQSSSHPRPTTPTTPTTIQHDDQRPDEPRPHARPQLPHRSVANSLSAPSIHALVADHRRAAELTVSHTPSPPRSRSGHARSISNPFPALFGAVKRSDRATASAGDAPGFESSDEDDHIGRRGRADRDGRLHSPTGGARARDGGEGPMTTGRCMTCDSSMRWPRDLTVFRCTICMTTNDLEPREWHVEGRQDDPAMRAGPGGGFPGPPAALVGAWGEGEIRS